MYSSNDGDGTVGLGMMVVRVIMMWDLQRAAMCLVQCGELQLVLSLKSKDLGL
jgi:hypothetical protein